MVDASDELRDDAALLVDALEHHRLLHDLLDDALQVGDEALLDVRVLAVAERPGREAGARRRRRRRAAAGGAARGARRGKERGRGERKGVFKDEASY